VEQLAPYQVSLPSPFQPRPDGELPAPRVIDWLELFGNDHPVELEVGFGKGLFLLTESQAHPERNYFGIEIVRKYQLYATTRIAIRQLPNVKTCCADAKMVLRSAVLPESVAVVHVYFPDPWWKNRHKKRLLFTPEFADLVLRVLVPGGILHFVSDVKDYFEMVSELLANVPALVPLPPREATAVEHDMDYLTNFERKFRKEGRPIYRSAYSKRTANPPA
jgi:tRNA (guanine-N7-)-methyltransferase